MSACLFGKISASEKKKFCICAGKLDFQNRRENSKFLRVNSIYRLSWAQESTITAIAFV